VWEDVDAWKAELACGNQSSPTALSAPRMISREWLGLPNPNLMHNHPEAAIKNWALRWTDGGHHRRQNRRMKARNRSIALLALQGRNTGRGPVRK
jgi:hypothetical protein